jgi:hypothetical protein
MAITRLSGGVTPGDGADPRTFPAIWNATADVLDDAILPSGGSAGQVLVKDSATDYDASWVEPAWNAQFGAQRILTGDEIGNLNSQWQAADRAFFSYFRITSPVTVTQWHGRLDNSATGNVEVGVVRLDSAQLLANLGAGVNIDYEVVARSGIITTPNSGSATITLPSTVLTAGDYAIFCWSDTTLVRGAFQDLGGANSFRRKYGRIDTAVGGISTTGSLLFGGGMACRQALTAV